MSLLQKIQEAGIVGQGGAGFPASVKLNVQVDILLINALECEPLLNTDKYIMMNFPRLIVEAIIMVKEQVGAKEAVIGIKKVNTKCINAMERAITDIKAQDVRVFQSDDYYPSGDEQMVVFDITGRVVPQGGLPLNVGVVVSNVGTMLEIYRANQGKPLTHKFLTLTGEINNPSVLKAPIGTSFGDCIQFGQHSLTDYKIISGGPFMGSIYNKDEVDKLFVTKTTSGIILTGDNNKNAAIKNINLKRVLNMAKSACIQCRMCTDLCPRHLIGHRLHPHKIMRMMSAAEFDGDQLTGCFIKANKEILQEALICCECSICETYACPMDILPRQVNIFVKNQFRREGFVFEKTKDVYPPHQVREYRKINYKAILARMGLGDLIKKVNTYNEINPNRVYISLKQHIGKPAVPVVKQGDKVEQGQLIARADGEISANIHASISGQITEIENHIEISS